MDGVVVNGINMYCAAEQMRIYICGFNWNYQRQIVEMDQRSVYYLQQLYEAGISDSEYWIGTGIEFNDLSLLIEKLSRALSEADRIYIYDMLNCNISFFLKEVFDVLFKKSGLELQHWFWKENCNALKKRYPNILEQLEITDSNSGELFVRPYGLRGKVFYRKNEQREYDLYSTYNPADVGVQMAQTINFEKYERIYIWGIDEWYKWAGHVFGQIHKSIEISIYVTSLSEFRRFLFNMPAAGFLVHPEVDWKINCEVKEFISNYSVEKNKNSYIYVSECLEDELKMLCEFIKENLLDSNIYESVK